MKWKVSFGLLTIALSLMASRQATAGTITLDALLAPPCSSCANPGFYNGSGNPNGGFVVVTDNGVEIGLRAKYRSNPAVIDTPTNVYNVVAGTQTTTTSGGNGANASRAAWSYDFSIDLRPNGAGSLTLADIFATMRVDDLTAATTTTIDLFSFIADNSTWGTAGQRSPDNTAAGVAGGDWGMQNSENCMFVGLCPAGFDPNANHLYQFTFTVGQKSLLAASSVLAQETMYVCVGSANCAAATVPEPASLALLGTGLAGLVVAVRRRRKS